MLHILLIKLFQVQVLKVKRDLAEGANGKEPEAYPHPIYNNVLPHIDVFLEDGYTKEEQKMIDETRKILHEPELKVTATCARVPVQDSHSVEIDVTLDKEATVQEIKDLFDKDERVVLVDNPEKMNILRHLTLLVEMKYL